MFRDETVKKPSNQLDDSERDFPSVAAPDWDEADSPFLPFGHELSQPSLSDSRGLSGSGFREPDTFRSLDLASFDHDDPPARTLDGPVFKSVAPLYKSVQLDSLDNFDYDMSSLGGAQLDGQLMGGLSLNPKSTLSSMHAPAGDSWALEQAAHLKPKDLVSAVDVVGAGPDASPRPPPAPGGYLEPNYHFMSCCEPDALFSALQLVLDQFAQQHCLDVCVLPNKFKLKCVTYPDGARLPFNVRVFSTDVEGQHAVEFQRRSGCILSFSSLYRDAKQALQKLGLCDGEQQECTGMSFGSSSLPELAELDDFQPTEEQCRDTVRCLLDMVRSDCIDIKVQGVQALAQLTKEKHSRNHICDATLELLVQSIGSPTECVHRCAVTSLANLAKHREDACRKLAQQNGILSLLSLAGCDRSTPQVVRECARALANVSSHLKDSIVCEQFKSKIACLAACADSKTQTYVADLRRNVGPAWSGSVGVAR